MLLYPQPVPGYGYGAPPPAAQNDEEEDAPTMQEILFGYGESAAEWKSEHQAQFTFVSGMPPQLPPHLLPAQQFYPVPQQPSMPQQVPTALFSEEPAAPAAAPVPEAPPVPEPAPAAAEEKPARPKGYAARPKSKRSLHKVEFHTYGRANTSPTVGASPKPATALLKHRGPVLLLTLSSRRPRRRAASSTGTT